VTIIAKKDGVVDKIDGKRIVVKAFEKDLSKSGVDIYNLLKFQKSNQNTTINQKPLVKVGDVIKKGDIIADGPSTKLGELALGRNVTVAFMPWLGYNFEDSILISERCVTDDVFTSVHIEEYELVTRDTKLGTEEITRDIPNISEESLRNLDESGVVYVGAEVKSGDILVGKVTPKGDSISNPEEKLLRSIFGEKATDVRDSSLKMPPGSNGIVVDVRVFNRHGIEKDERSTAIERAEIESVQEDKSVEEEILERNIKLRAIEMIKNKKLSNDFKQLKANDFNSMDDFIFHSPEDKTKSCCIRTAWEKAIKRSAITDFRFHDLRHSTASYLAMNGATLLEIADILGHKTLQMVKRYSHLSEDHKATVLEKMNENIFG